MKTNFIIVHLILMNFFLISGSRAQTISADTLVGSTYLNNYKWKYYTYNSLTNEKIRDLPYESVYEFKEGFALVKCPDGKYGFIDEKGNEVVSCQYDRHTAGFSEGLARVHFKNAYNFIDITGKEVFNSWFSHASSFSEGLAYVEYLGSGGFNYRGFIDKLENKVLRLSYKYVQPFFCGRALVESAESNINNIGFIDKTGKEIIPPKYDFASDFRNGLAFVILEENEGFIDTEGNEIIPVIYEEARWFFDTMYKVKLNGKWGVLDPTGKEISSLKYTLIDTYCLEGLVKVQVENKHGLLSCINGNEIVAPKYDEIGLFHEGLAKVKTENKYGYVDMKGVEVIAPKYDELGRFKSELARVKVGDKSGFIDKLGNEVISLIYDIAFDFDLNTAKVMLKGKVFYIDKTGKKVKIK